MVDDIVDDIADDETGEEEDDDEDDEHGEIEDEEEEEFEVPAELEEIPAEKEPGSDLEVLRAKLRKSLEELEDIRSDMQASFTSTNTISTTIQSIKGMLDALKKDQMNILSREQ